MNETSSPACPLSRSSLDALRSSRYTPRAIATLSKVSLFVIRWHITVVVGDDQSVLVAETSSAALRLVASAPGTPSDELLRIAMLPSPAVSPFRRWCESASFGRVQSCLLAVRGAQGASMGAGYRRLPVVPVRRSGSSLCGRVPHGWGCARFAARFVNENCVSSSPRIRARVGSLRVNALSWRRGPAVSLRDQISLAFDVLLVGAESAYHESDVTCVRGAVMVSR